jgi:hypothetical protein
LHSSNRPDKTAQSANAPNLRNSQGQQLDSHSRPRIPTTEMAQHLSYYRIPRIALLQPSRQDRTPRKDFDPTKHHYRDEYSAQATSRHPWG